jgi:hypothetical protein
MPRRLCSLALGDRELKTLLREEEKKVADGRKEIWRLDVYLRMIESKI